MSRSSADVEQEVEAERDRLDQTVEALRDKLTPGEIVDEVSRAAGDAGQEMLANLLDQARRNPMPVALIGLGVAWLMTSSGRSGAGGDVRRGSTDRSPIAGASGASAHGAASYGEPYAGADRSGGALGGLADKARDLGQTLSQKAHDLGDKASDMVSGARDKVSDMNETMTNRASSLGRSGAAATDQVQGAARDAARRASEAADRATRRVSDMVRAEPLLIGAAGLLVGFAIGSALPGTSAEDEALGPTRDALLQRGRELARDTLDHAGEIAQAAYAAARSEVQGAATGEDAGSEDRRQPETL